MVKDIDKEEIVPDEWNFDPYLGEWNYYFSDGKDGHWRITCSSDVWSLSDYCIWNAKTFELNEDWEDVYMGKEIPLAFPRHYIGGEEEDLKVAALAKASELFPDAGLSVNSVSLHTMTQYIADEAHFKEVIARVPNVKRSLWIGTADIKDLYVGDRPFLGILADLISKGREVRLIHAKEPGPNFREDFDRYPVLFTGLERALCPRVHFKMIIFDCKVAYIGSANLTGAGIGMKGATTRNFEAGILTDDPALVDAAMNQFDSVWAGFRCKDCRRKQYCPDPILNNSGQGRI